MANSLYVDELQVRGKSYDLADVNARDSILSIEDLITNVEQSETLAHNYNIGDYFIYKDNIYKVTSTILAGATMSENNCTLYNKRKAIILDAEVANEKLTLVQLR